MARVFAHSAQTHCPAWQLVFARLPMPARRIGESESYITNTRKLDHWCEAVASARDGDELLLIDADTVILQPIDDIWERAFDLAYTVRPPGYPCPINGGVVFVRVSPSTRLFMAAWGRINRQMLTHKPLRDKWRRYAGLNQRAFGSLLEQKPGDYGVMLPLPCAEWNCEDATWSTFDTRATRILHVKSSLRSAIFERPGAARPHLRVIARHYAALEQIAAEARP